MANYKEGGYELDHNYFLDYRDGKILYTNDIRDEDTWESKFEGDAEMVCRMLNDFCKRPVFKVIEAKNNMLETVYNIIVDDDKN